MTNLAANQERMRNSVSIEIAPTSAQQAIDFALEDVSYVSADDKKRAFAKFGLDAMGDALPGRIFYDHPMATAGHISLFKRSFVNAVLARAFPDQIIVPNTAAQLELRAA